MATTGIALDPHCAAHVMGPHHPESPQRLRALIELLASERVAGLDLRDLPERLATADDVQRVHTSAYFEQIQSTAGRVVRLDPDTTACEQSYDAALRAAGATLGCIDAVLAGTVRNAFALVRPPGHHAEPFRAMGFCLFNSVAVAADYARAVHGLERVAVIDFDVHHGNGTQSAFYDDPRTLYVSTHQFPYYPGSGAAYEVGRGDGRGATLNVPLSPGHGDDTFDALYGAVLPRVLEQFRPDIILVSAGFDLMRNDPLAGMDVTADGVGRIAAALTATAERLCDGRLVMLLEGGYDLANLQDGAVACLRAMHRQEGVDAAVPAVDTAALGEVARALEPLREFYKL